MNIGANSEASAPVRLSHKTPGPNFLPRDGSVVYIPKVLSLDDSREFFEKIITAFEWRQDPVKIFGREVLQPRKTAWVGDEGAFYHYSGLSLTPLPWTTELTQIRQCVESVTGLTFNSALLNLYRDGSDSMGWHRDNEKELGSNPVIASVSLGATRVFKLRHYFDKHLKLHVPLESGSLLIMSGATQHFWEHCIPKTMKPVGPRLNITFRIVTPKQIPTRITG